MFHKTPRFVNIYNICRKASTAIDTCLVALPCSISMKYDMITSLTCVTKKNVKSEILMDFCNHIKASTADPFSKNKHADVLGLCQ